MESKNFNESGNFKVQDDGEDASNDTAEFNDEVTNDACRDFKDNGNQARDNGSEVTKDGEDIHASNNAHYLEDDTNSREDELYIMSAQQP